MNFLGIRDKYPYIRRGPGISNNPTHYYFQTARADHEIESRKAAGGLRCGYMWCLGIGTGPSSKIEFFCSFGYSENVTFSPEKVTFSPKMSHIYVTFSEKLLLFFHFGPDP